MGRESIAWDLFYDDFIYGNGKRNYQAGEDEIAQQYYANEVLQNQLMFEHIPFFYSDHPQHHRLSPNQYSASQQPSVSQSIEQRLGLCGFIRERIRSGGM